MLWPWCMSKWNGFSDCICLIRCMCGTVPFPGVAKSGALQVPEEGSDRDTESEGTHHRHMPSAGKTSGVEWRAYFLERLVWLEGAPVSVPWLSPPYRFWASETLCKELWTLFPVTSTHLGHHGWVVSCNEIVLPHSCVKFSHFYIMWDRAYVHLATFPLKWCMLKAIMNPWLLFPESLSTIQKKCS